MSYQYTAVMCSNSLCFAHLQYWKYKLTTGERGLNNSYKKKKKFAFQVMVAYEIWFTHYESFRENTLI